MPAPKLLTYGDVVEHLMDYSGGTTDASSQRAIRKSVPLALQKLALEHDWKYFYAAYRITTVESYGTGTIEYTHSTRTLTLTGGTWPTWAIYGTIRIGERIHRVASQTSSTVLILSSVHNPGEDIAALTTYEIYQSIYTLPGDFKAMNIPRDSLSAWDMHEVTADEWLRLDGYSGASGDGLAYAVLGDPYKMGSMALHLWGYPTAITGKDFIYQRTPRELRFSGYANGEFGGTRTGASTSGTGTVTAAAAGAGVTVNSGALLDEMVGCVLRVGRTAAVPEGIGGLNPWREQKIITEVTNATTAEVDSNWVNNYTTVGYTISDPIDLPPQLLDAFLRGCEKQLCLARPQSRERLEDATREYETALVIAKENDAGPLQMRSAWDRPRSYRLSDRSVMGPEVDFPN